MSNEESKSDAVKEARELLSHLSDWPNSIPDIKHALFADAVERERDSPFFGCSTHVADLYGRAPELFSTLCDEVEELRRRNETQADSIMEFQQEQKAFNAAASELLAALKKAVVYAPNVKKAADALRSAITPKGSEQQRQ